MQQQQPAKKQDQIYGVPQMQVEMIQSQPQNITMYTIDQNQNIQMFVNKEQVTRKVPKKRKPEEIFCNHCQSISHTTVKFINGKCAKCRCLAAGILCMIGCCCLIPFVLETEEEKDCQHYCGKCKQYLVTIAPKKS